MIKIYLKDNVIEDGDGNEITDNYNVIRAAEEGRVAAALVKAMRSHGLRPAWGEEIVIECRENDEPNVRTTLDDFASALGFDDAA